MPYKYHAPPDNAPGQTRQRIIAEFKRWRDQAEDPKTIGAFDFPLSRKIGGHEAAVRFELRGESVEMFVDKFDSYGINLTACYLAIQSMRLNEARGIGETLQRAYAALPAPERHRDPYEVLGVHSTMELEDIEVLYRSKARRLGEGHAGLTELNVAMDRIREDKR